MWTLQEIKLATRAVVVTATGGVEFRDMVAHLEGLQALNEPKYHNLYIWAATMARTEGRRLTLRDLVTACVDRNSGFDLDYARAFFPILKLEWEPGMTREEGMRKIYRAYLGDALALDPFAGSPRMKLFPGWAPSYLQGLEGIGHHKLQSEARGVRGEWHVLKITSLISSTDSIYGKVGLTLSVEGDDASDVQCVCGPNEDPQVIEAVKAMIAEGRGWILSVTTFAEQYSTEWARSVLIAEDAEVSPQDGTEVAVHCSAVMTGLKLSEENRLSLLIRHWNPNVDEDLPNLVKYLVK